MPAGLIERLDTHAANHEYTGRSEVIRESARAFLTEFDDDALAAEPLAGVVTVFYDFDTHPVERQVTELRHEYDAHIVSNDHSHVADYCVDLFVLESDLEVIATFVGKLRAIEAVETVDYSLVTVDSIGQLQND